MNNTDDSKKNQDNSIRITEANPNEFDEHMAFVFRRYATSSESVLNLLENGQYIAAWKKMQGIRDGMAYYMNASEQRIAKRNVINESNSK